MGYRSGLLLTGSLPGYYNDIVTHNALIAQVADRVIRLKNGKIESNELNKYPKNIEEVEW